MAGLDPAMTPPLFYIGLNLMHFDRTKASAMVLIAAALLSAGAAFAQTRLPSDTEKQIGLPAKGAKTPVRNPCSAYGPGFVRIEGSESCVKVGGNVSVESSRSVRGR